ncbi:MAG: hypothetical protein CFH41_00547 [Alphaproteobacteria bacterium MarineAlpha11_Bin1]|nr:MAG: hypothetical protein CFH41_00547 [Alphaproteobacteria bacterium MarineAlpha11_Bin1]
MPNQERGYHDIGGDPRHATSVSSQSMEPPGWAHLTDALRTALGDRYRLHEQRRKIEELGEDVYESVTYYEIRVIALLEMVVERGFLTRDQVTMKMAEITKRGR